ncbi:MAG: spondin domain-containing protein [Bacteroidota bacterium]
MSFKLLSYAVLLALFVPVLSGCDSDDDDDIDPVDQSRTFTVTIDNVGPANPVLKSGVFNTPVGASDPAPIGPGGAYEVTFTAGPGQRLSFSTMFIQSNDLFYAFPGSGLPLYLSDGSARTGDVTAELNLYDAGTEVNEEPGTGPNQAPRQPGPDTGTDENGVVQRVVDVNDGFKYPGNNEVIRATLEHDGNVGFTFRIENVGGQVNGQDIPLSPGSWAVHSDMIAYFERGAVASGGIEAIAEDGNPAPSAAELAPVTGLTVPLSPGAYAVHTDAVAFFESGTAASGGIEAIAEDGDPSVAAGELAGVAGINGLGAFDTPVGASAPAPIGPGGSYTFTFDASPGELLSFATMYIQSNDLYYTFPGQGLELFPGGTAVSGDVTAQVRLYDAGTEVDEEPGVGLNQAPRQAGPDTGVDENGVVTRVQGTDDGFTYPAPSEIIRVTITSQ